MAKKEKTEVYNYYSRGLSSERIEEVDIQNVTIPEDFYDDSKDVIESTNQEDYVDFNDFEENMEEDLENLGFEGKTQEELQDFIMQKLMGNVEELNAQEEKVAEFKNIEEITTEEMNQEESLQEPETEIETETQETTENTQKIDIMPVNYSLPEEAPMSMFQMTEEETQNALENVQAEFANINKPTEETEKTEEAEEYTEEDPIYHDPFEEYKRETSSKKKYVFAIHQKFAYAIDAIPVDEREEFIEHAIKLKIDSDNNEKAKFRKIDFVIKLILIIATIVVSTPIAFKAVNWSVDSTIKNYEYCQKSFEKLFKKRFHYQK